MGPDAGWRTDGGADALEVAVSGLLKIGQSGEGERILAERWRGEGPRVLRDCHGDFAVAVRDRASSTLWMARSPISIRPLFFCGTTPDDVRCGPLAGELSATPGRLSVSSLVEWYGGLVGSSVGSMFEGVEGVAPGCIVQVDRKGVHHRRHWNAADIKIDRSASDEELARDLRAALEMAVRDRLPAGEPASLLSAGRDSGCVSALAALLLSREGRRLHCFTASPGRDPRYGSMPLLMDEWPGAATVAALHPNIVHHAITPVGVRFCMEAEAIYRVHSAPLGNPLSLHWWVAAQRAAAEMGCEALLTGGMGNLSISDGGPIYLADLAADGEWPTWWRAARDVAQFEGASWLNILNVSFGGYVPPRIYRILQRLRGRMLPASVAPFLQGEFRRRLIAEHRSQDQRPPRRSRQRGADLLTAMDVGDVSPERRFGLTMADPTADRRVVEAALRIPPERLVSRYDRRPIFELAFGDLLPPETVRAPRRAYQSMDWNRAYDVDDLAEGLSRYAGNALVTEMLDLGAMSAALRRWPGDRLATLEETAEFGDGLLRAFALAAFLHVHFPS